MADGQRLAWLRDEGTGQLVELYQVPRGSPLYEPFRPQRRFHTPLLFGVRNAEPLIRRLRRMGARVRRAFDEGEVRITFVSDPEGTLVELVSWTESAGDRHPDPPLIDLVRPPRTDSARTTGHRAHGR